MSQNNLHQSKEPLPKEEKFTRLIQQSYLQVCGFLLGISFMILISFTGLSRSNPLFQLLFFLPFFIYVLTVFLIRKFSLSINRKSLLTIISISIIIQSLLLMMPITLSDDVYRYFLEGKALLNGINPYKVPLSDLPAFITEGYLTKANNTSLVSPYPPLALFLFLILAFIFDNPSNFRIIFSLAFILAILGLEKLLSDKNKWMIIVFAWNPLLLLETVSGSHFEPLVVLILIIGLIALKNKKSVIAAISFVGAFFFKYYAIVFIILYWKKFTGRGKGIIAASLTLYGLWILLDPSIIQGLVPYATIWYFNASLVWLLSETTFSLMQSKIILEGVFIVIFAIITVKVRKTEVSPHEIAGLVIGIFLLLQPTFHPWYIFWVFPFILLDNPKVFWSWIALTGLLVLSYDSYILYDQYGIWSQSIFNRILIYIPFYLIFIYELAFKGREDTLKRLASVHQGV